MMYPKNLIVLIVFCFQFFIGQSLDAQAVVNIEQKRIVTDTLGWAGNATMNFQYNKNIVEQFSLNTSAHVQFKAQKSLYLLLGNLALLEAGNKDFVNSGFLHFRYNRKMGKLLRWEAFSQVQFNRLLQVRQRILVGTGPRLKLLSSKKFSLYQATLVMYEHEEILMPVEVFDDYRISAYVSSTWHPTENTTISSTIYFQPLFSDFADNRLLNQTKISFGITKRLKFTTTFSYLRDSNPPLEVPKEIYSVTNGLQYRF